MYESPIDKIIGEMKSQMVKDEESQLMVQVSQTVGYDIDKNELIRALNYDRQQYEKGYVDGLKASKWIPVSERLPKFADVYRVTRCYPNNVMNPTYFVDACFFDGSNTWYNDNRINHDRAVNNVIAWQENPEPYEPQESKGKGMTLKEAFNVLKQYIFYDNKDIPDFYTLAEAIEVINKAAEQDAVGRRGDKE